MNRKVKGLLQKLFVEKSIKVYQCSSHNRNYKETYSLQKSQTPLFCRF